MTEVYTKQDLLGMRSSELRTLASKLGADSHGCLEKMDFVECIERALGYGGQLPTEQSDVAVDDQEPTTHFDGVTYWNELYEICKQFESMHSSQLCLKRRAYSWARTLAFARVLTGRVGTLTRRGDDEWPFTVWVLGATDETEVDLAQGQYFDDANWIDRAPTRVILWGNDLGELPDRGPPLEGSPARVWTAHYAEMEATMATEPPDMCVLYMPDFDKIREELPEQVQTIVAEVPLLVSLRYSPRKLIFEELQRSLGSDLHVEPTRCVFSGSGGNPLLDFDDNGWVFVVTAKVVFASDWPRIEPAQLKALGKNQKLPALFWGIIDLKFDTRKPLSKRVKVLETGDGRISKFSHDGAEIPKRFEKRFKDVQTGPRLKKYSMISADKLLTNELMHRSGYGHLVAKQACLQRVFDGNLRLAVTEFLQSDESLKGQDDRVVLKLCNRSRGAGVLVTRVHELMRVLESLLELPEDMDTWFRLGEQCLKDGSAADVGVIQGSFEEHQRHWWGNECPFFLAEEYVESMPLVQDERIYDATMRVSFVLRMKDEAPTSEAAPSDLKVEWLGGYWKLPAYDSLSAHGDLRSRCISAARTAGTAPVQDSHLHEVYAALGDSMQQLFGGADIDVKKIAGDRPDRMAYLLVRVAMSLEDAQLDTTMEQARQILDSANDDLGTRCAESFLTRCLGVTKVKPCGQQPGHLDEWKIAHLHFQESVEWCPVNANALFWLGMSNLEIGELDQSVSFMNRSLLIDPDFKGPYVNLGVAYLRLSQWVKAIQISTACLERFPDSPQCQYHIGIASYQLATMIFNNPSSVEACSTLAVRTDVQTLCKQAIHELMDSRKSAEAQKRKPSKLGRLCSPWNIEDDIITDFLEDFWWVPSPEPPTVEMPLTVGWRFMNWRV